MINKQFDELRRRCGAFLKANDLKPTTKTGAKLVHAFWYGALCALNDRDNAYVSVCLLSGRYSDLVSYEEVSG